MTYNFDFSQTRRMYQESTFNAYTVGNTTNREGFTDTAVLTADNDAFEYLDTFTVAFDNLYVYLDRIARAEIRDVVTKLFLFKYADDVHVYFPPIRHSCPRHHLAVTIALRTEDCLN